MMTLNSLRIFVCFINRVREREREAEKVFDLQNDINYAFSPINCIRLQLVVYPVEQSSRIK